MLKLTMCPRKRSKRHRLIPHRLRLPSSNFMDIDEPDLGDHEHMLSDNLQAMLKQEESGKYDCADYLSVTSWQQHNSKPKFELTRRASCPSHGARIDEYCREQIVEWSFRVVDYFRIDREVVAVSLSFLDRFLASYRCDRKLFKLAATTTLHLAVKLLYPCKLADLGILSDLSRGEFEMKDVCDMEERILRNLSWNLHPPTAMAFSAIFLDYFFASRVVTISGADLDDLYDVSSFFGELAVCDYYFVHMRPSTIALASIMNALEGMFGPNSGLANDMLHVAQSMKLNLHDLGTVRNRLWELYERSEECAIHNDKFQEDDHNASFGGIFVKKSATHSPVSVQKPCHSATDFVCPPHDLAFRNGSW